MANEELQKTKEGTEEPETETAELTEDELDRIAGGKVMIKSFEVYSDD